MKESYLTAPACRSGSGSYCPVGDKLGAGRAEMVGLNSGRHSRVRLVCDPRLDLYPRRGQFGSEKMEDRLAAKQPVFVWSVLRHGRSEA
jgi:hypothetical protein